MYESIQEIRIGRVAKHYTFSRQFTECSSYDHNYLLLPLLPGQGKYFTLTRFVVIQAHILFQFGKNATTGVYTCAMHAAVLAASPG